jgi:hypothetical protein
VLLDCPLGDDEEAGDGAVGTAFGHQCEHLAFAGGESGERGGARAGAKQLGYDFGIKRGAARGDAAQGADELVNVADPVLQQVADARRPRPARRFGSARVRSLVAGPGGARFAVAKVIMMPNLGRGWSWATAVTA